MRTRTGRANSISATDAIVAALAVNCVELVVLTSAPDDLRALLDDSDVPVTVARA